jgi:PEP-CTERM putative exosortase interaction domain/probable extracellular repeat, HAF family
MRLCVRLCLTLVVLASPGNAVPLPMFAGLPSPFVYPHPVSSEPTLALGISADGQIAVGEAAGYATRWTSGGAATLLPGSLVGASWANAITADHAVAVGAHETGQQNAFGNFTEAVRWLPNGTREVLNGPDAYTFSEARDVSADGAVIIGNTAGESGIYNQAFSWTSQGGMLLLGDLPGGAVYSVAQGVSADGSRIVGTSEWAPSGSIVSYREAVVWTPAGGIIRLGDLPGSVTSSAGFAISADGNAVVGSSDSANGFEAFRWTEQSGMVGLGQLPGGSAGSSDDTPFAVSGDGSVIVGTATSPTAPSNYEAFVWDADHGMQSLKAVLAGYGVDTTGWDLIEARGISDDGLTIAGWGYNPNGVEQAWIAVIPEPGTAGLLAAGLAMLGWRRRRGSTAA